MVAGVQETSLTQVTMLCDQDLKQREEKILNLALTTALQKINTKDQDETYRLIVAL